MEKPRLFWIALAGCCAMSSAADSRPDDSRYDPAKVAQDAALQAAAPHAATHARAELERAFWDCDHAATIRFAGRRRSRRLQPRHGGVVADGVRAGFRGHAGVVAAQQGRRAYDARSGQSVGLPR